MKQINIIFIVRELAGGGIDTLLKTYIKYLSRDKRFNILVISSLPVSSNSIFQDLIDMNIKVIVPKSNRDILFKILSVILYYPRKILFNLGIRKNNISIALFRENIKKKFYLVKLFFTLIKMNFQNKENAIYHSIGARLELKIYNYFFKLKRGLFIFTEVEDPTKRETYINDFSKFINNCDYILCPSNIIKNKLTNMISIIKPPILITPWIIDDSDIEYSSVGIDSEEKILTFGSLGRFDYLKGFHVLIEALSKINEKYKNWKLLITGDGEEKNNLVNLAEKLNIKDKIIFTGWVKNVNDFFNKIDIFIHPSFSEGMPLVIIEAMYHSKPIIATKVGSVPEMIDEVNGFIVEPDNVKQLQDKIEYFILNNNMIEKMSLNSKSLYNKKFSPKVIINNITEIYLQQKNK